MAATLLVRADADGRIGTGHVMRCLALAQAWQAAGGRTVFLSRCPVEKLAERISAAGAQLVPLPCSHPDPADLDTTLDLLARTKSENPSSVPTWVVLDGYHFDTPYQQAIRAAGGRLLAIDDMAHLDHYAADLLLNQNFAADRLDYPCDADATLLLGSRYVLLRPEFRPRQSFRREIPETARRLLVTLGGADPNNVTWKVLQALARLDVSHWEAKVVVGPANPHLEILREQLRQTGVHVELLSDVGNMPELMAWADVAVSAAGTTCWELAWMQLPAAVLVLADNQELVARRLSEAGAVINLGRADQLTPEAIAAALSVLCRNRNRRAGQSEAGRRLVDGRGADRVVAVMEALAGPLPIDQLELRPAAAEDMLPLWRLVNDPTVRHVSLASSERIPLDEHIAWFGEKLSSPDTRIWILDFHGLILAVIRYDRTNRDTAQISLNVAVAFRQRGLGTQLLEVTQETAREELAVDRLRAVVRQDNIPSARTFAKAGFVKVNSRPVRNHPCHVFEQTSQPASRGACARADERP